MFGSRKWCKRLQRLLHSSLLFGLSELEIPNSDMNRKKDEQYYLAWEGEKVDESDDEEMSEFPNRYDYLHTRAAGDMQHFEDKLKGYLQDGPNVWFYQNRIPSEPDGVCIDKFHESWFGKYEKLESVHSYIQWLFPIQEKGMNYLSYPLSHKEIQIFRRDEELKKKLLKSYKLMLDFYGIELLEPQEQQEMQEQQEQQELQEPQKLQEPQIGEVRRANNWEKRFENLNRNTHNNLRITRILKCLGILGLSQYQAPLVKFFLQETLVNKTLPRVKRSVLDYFIFAVLDENKRNELIRFAFQHFEPKEQFMWCPKNSKIFRKKKSNPESENEKTAQHPDDLKNNTEHHEGTNSAPGLGLNTGSKDQDAKNQEDKSLSDSKKYAEVQKSGSKAGDKNVPAEAGTDKANSAKAENSVQCDNNENSDGSVTENQTKDNSTDTNANKYSEINDEIPKDSNKASQLDTNTDNNLQRSKDQKHGSEATDEIVTAEAGTQKYSELHCTKAGGNQVSSDKSTDGSTCENPTEATDTGTNSNKVMKSANFNIQDNDKAEDDVTAYASTNVAQVPGSVHQTKSTEQAEVSSDKTSDEPTS